MITDKADYQFPDVLDCEKRTSDVIYTVEPLYCGHL